MNNDQVFVTNIVIIAGKYYRIIGKNEVGHYIGINVLTGIKYHISPTLIKYVELFA